MHVIVKVSCISCIFTGYAISLLAVYSVKATCHNVPQSKTKCCFRSRLLSIKSSWRAHFSDLLGYQPCKRIIQLVISCGVPPFFRQNDIRFKDSLLPIGFAQIILQPCFQWEKHITTDYLKQLPLFHNYSRFAQQMKLASVLIRVAIFKNENVLNNIERDISGLEFF